MVCNLHKDKNFLRHIHPCGCKRVLSKKFSKYRKPLIKTLNCLVLKCGNYNGVFLYYSFQIKNDMIQ